MRKAPAPKSRQKPPVAESNPDFMLSLARGMEVLRAFDGHRRQQRISQISQRTDIPRAAVRRCLHTLMQLGYVETDGTVFSLRPQILLLGFAYLSSTPLAAAAQPVLDRIRDTLHESSSAGVLDADKVFYVARSETKRIMAIQLRAGSHLPAYCTSMGRVLLAHLPERDLEAYLSRNPLTPLTTKTVTTRTKLLEKLEAVRRNDYALVDQELEIGLRSIAVPVRDREGRVVAALNVGTQPARTPMHQLETRFLGELRRGAAEISRLL